MMAIPESSPRVMGKVICSGCSTEMRSEIISNHKGKLVNVKASCDKCKYTGTLELPYANMQTVAYEPRPLPQPVASVQSPVSEPAPPPLAVTSVVPVGSVEGGAEVAS